MINREEIAAQAAALGAAPGAPVVDAASGSAEGERDGRRRRRGGRGRGERDDSAAATGSDTPVNGDQGLSTAEAESNNLGTAQDAGLESSSTGGDTDAREGGRRGRGRGGRGRRERVEGQDDVGTNADATTLSEAQGGAEPAPSLNADVAADASAVGSDVSDATPVAASVELAPAPVVAEAPPVEPYVLPLASLHALAEEAGLSWVNSDPEKIQAAQEAIAREPKPVHVPRERKPAPVLDEGPLVLVETRKDLNHVQLPFDTQA